MSNKPKPIPGYPGYYVDRSGKVWSSKRGPRLKLLAKHSNTYGYVHVSLMVDKRSTSVAVHRLLLLTFKGKPKADQETRHLNGIKTDNRMGNLKWGTRKEQAADRRRHGTERHDKALTDDEIGEVNRLYKAGGIKQKELAQMFGVTQSAISSYIPEIVSNKGERNANTKFAPETVIEIRKLAANGIQQKALAERFGVKPMCISRIVRRQRWNHI